MKSTLRVTEDNVDLFNKSIKGLRSDEVLVGIPSTNSSRQNDMNNNAAILAINEFGSPQNNIPARPVMTIGITKAQEEIAEQFKKAAQSIMNGKLEIDRYFNRAGIIASTSIKKVINNQEGIAPPSPYTLKLRQEQGFKGTKALIVTGQMRNSITYVVRGED